MSMKRRVQSDGGRRCMVRIPSSEKKVGNIEFGGNPKGVTHAKNGRCEETMKRRKLFLEWSLHDFDGGGD